MNRQRTQALTLRDEGRIYFDHNATTPLAAEIPSYVSHLLHHWGNPSSIHYSGRGPKTLIREARQNLARMLGCGSLELIFTSGGSEANNLAIKGVYESVQGRFSRSASSKRPRFLVSAVEHPSVSETFQYLKSKGAEVERIPVSRQGAIDLDAFEKMIDENVALVSVMMANNETGNVFPVKKMVKIAHKHGALFHTDGVQALGKIEFNLHDMGVDYASFAAHKFYSLKGAGALYVKKGAPLTPQIHGGRQERSRRAGTENVLALACWGLMARKADEVSGQFNRVKALRDGLESEVIRRISGVRITGVESSRLPNTASFVIDDIDGESLLMNLDIEGVSVSTGAACSSGNPEPSPVLLAMGLSRLEAQSSLRVSLGWGSTEEEVDRFIEILIRVVSRLRNLRADSRMDDRPGYTERSVYPEQRGGM